MPLILTVGISQRLRSNHTFSPLNLQPRAATKPSRLRIVAISLSILWAALRLGNPLPQPIKIDVVAVCVNASLQAIADGTGLPRNLEPDLTPIPLLIEGNLLHDKT
jgi:hypothetical protein